MHGFNRTRNRLLLAGIALAAAVLFAAALFGDVESGAGDMGRANVVRLPVNSTVLPPVPPPEPETPAEPVPAAPEGDAAASRAGEPQAPAQAEQERAEAPEPEPAPAAKPLPAGPGLVTGVEFTPTADSFSMRIATDRPVGRYTFFTLKGAGKFVFDLHGQWKKQGKLVYRPKSGPVSKVVVGEHADKIRFVLLVKNGVGRAKPFFTETGNGVEVRLNGL